MLVAQRLTQRPTHDLDFVGMLRTLARFADDELPVALTDTSALRAFFADWIAELA